MDFILTIRDKGHDNNKQFTYEESNVSVWNTTGGNQDVPAGEGVPEAPYRV